MANSRDFLDHLRRATRAGGRSVSVRAMFGGHGVYVDGLFVAIVDDDVLYLRADDRNRAEFSASAVPPFAYTTKDGARARDELPPRARRRARERARDGAVGAVGAGRRAQGGGGTRCEEVEADRGPGGETRVPGAQGCD